MALTHSPDPSILDAGPGTAADQTARPQRLADHANGGWDDVPPPIIPATGATAGIPGTFTPAGSTPPADVAGMTGLTASPTSAWTVGQYVQTQTAGAAGRAYWSGTAWTAGTAPAAVI